jgi:hypothetical protein
MSKVLQKWECHVVSVNEVELNVLLFPLEGQDVELCATIYRNAIGDEAFDDIKEGEVFEWSITTDENNPSTFALLKQPAWTEEELVEARTEAKELYDLFND